MKSVVATNRFVIGDVVSWTSKNGSQYKGAVVSIKEGVSDDLIIVRLNNGQHRSFYDLSTDVTFHKDNTTKW